MAHSHYVLDLYYSDDRGKDTLSREVMRIEAHDDTEAIDEGIRVSGWRHPVRFDVRAITSSSRTGDRLIHSATAAPEGPPVETPSGGQSELDGSA